MWTLTPTPTLELNLSNNMLGIEMTWTWNGNNHVSTFLLLHQNEWKEELLACHSALVNIFQSDYFHKFINTFDTLIFKTRLKLIFHLHLCKTMCLWMLLRSNSTSSISSTCSAINLRWCIFLIQRLDTGEDLTKLTSLDSQRILVVHTPLNLSNANRSSIRHKMTLH